MAKRIEEMNAIINGLREKKPDGGIRFLGLHFDTSDTRISSDFCKVHRAIESGVLKPRHVSTISL